MRSNLPAVLQAFEDRLKQLEDAFNTNTKVFSDGIQMLEAQNEVLRRVAQDLFNGVKAQPNGLLVPRTKDNGIDFNAYLKEYIEELAASEAKKEEAPTASVLASTEDESPIIFGGS